MATKQRPRFGSAWALLLAGPVVGTTYFMVVYLLAEASCSEHVDLFGSGALRLAIIAGATAAVAVLVACALLARRQLADAAEAADAADASGQRGQNQRFMISTAVLLLGLFVVFVLFLAAPAIGTSLC